MTVSAAKQGDSSLSLRVLYGANFVSMLGTSTLFIFNIWLSYTLAESGVQFALLIAVATLPSILLGTQIGALTDRFDTRTLMVISESTRVLWLVLFFCIHYWWQPTLGSVGCFIFAMSISERIFKINQRKCLRKLASDAHLSRASAALSISTQLGAIIGGALGGVLTAFEPSWVLIINMGTFFLSGVLLFTVLKPAAPSPAGHAISVGFWGALKQTYPLIAQNPQAMFWYSFNTLIVVSIQIINLLVFPFIAVHLKGDAMALGWIEAAIATGSILGSLVLIRAIKKGISERWMMQGALVLLALSLWLFSLNRSLLVACVLYGVIGVALASFALFSAAAQRSVAYEHQGRVHATFASITATTSMVFAILSGAGMDWFEPDVLYQIFASLMAAMTLMFFFYSKQFEQGRGP